MENIIDRLTKYMIFKGLNPNKITTEAKLSVGLIGKSIKSNKGLHSETIEKILSTYIEINPEWFILGKGEMLKETTLQGKNEPNAELEITTSDGKIAFLEEQNELLKITSTNKDEMILFYKEKIDFVEIKLQDCENEKKLLKGSKPSL